MKKVIKALLITVLLLFCALLLWLYALHLLFYRRTVLETPICFDPGFSLTREFTVDIPVKYWVAIQYDDIFRSTVEVPVPRDEFTAEFEVTSQNKLIAKGSTATYPDWSGPWASNRDHVTRYLNSFDAERGKIYQVSLRITSAQPRLVPKNPKAMVVVDWGFDEFRKLRESLLVYVGAGIGIAVFLYGCFALRSRLSREF